jgi:hypothetical protein
MVETCDSRTLCSTYVSAWPKRWILIDAEFASPIGAPWPGHICLKSRVGDPIQHACICNVATCRRWRTCTRWPALGRLFDGFADERVLALVGPDGDRRAAAFAACCVRSLTF